MNDIKEYVDGMIINSEYDSNIKCQEENVISGGKK